METVQQEASRRKLEFPNLTWPQILSEISNQRKTKTGSGKPNIDILTCLSCGHEVFYDDANIIHAKDYTEVDLWSCGKCGHTNHFINESK